MASRILVPSLSKCASVMLVVEKPDGRATAS